MSYVFRQPRQTHNILFVHYTCAFIGLSSNRVPAKRQKAPRQSVDYDIDDEVSDGNRHKARRHSDDDASDEDDGQERHMDFGVLGSSSSSSSSSASSGKKGGPTPPTKKGKGKDEHLVGKAVRHRRRAAPRAAVGVAVGKDGK